jgi:hypothetical protein
MTNQRQDTRLKLEKTTVRVTDCESGIEFTGKGTDLSGTGLRFESCLEPAVGADMQICLEGAHASTPPLRAEVHVLRVARTTTGHFDVAASITRAL